MLRDLLAHLQSVTRTLRTLTFQSLAGTLCSTWFNVQKLYIVVTMGLCVFYESHNKQQPLPYTSLKDWFL
jgi:hypothetical protein